jgi:nitric oxide reductase subunit C
MKTISIFISLSFSFLIYSFYLYLAPIPQQEFGIKHQKMLSEGRLVWQKYNCQACHQIYGLGGYLGPDLTNEYSRTGKNENLIKAFIVNGAKQMPGFKMSEFEMKKLVGFLIACDSTGNANPQHFSISKSGMIYE